MEWFAAWFLDYRWRMAYVFAVMMAAGLVVVSSYIFIFFYENKIKFKRKIVLSVASVSGFALVVSGLVAGIVYFTTLGYNNYGQFKQLTIDDCVFFYKGNCYTNSEDAMRAALIRGEKVMGANDDKEYLEAVKREYVNGIWVPDNESDKKILDKLTRKSL